MFRIHTAALVAGFLMLPAVTVAQGAPTAAPHMIVVRLVNRGGKMPFGFEPGTITAQRGDTLRFVEDAGVMHNVHFTDHPRDAKLGGAAIGPYLTKKGQTYDVVVDKRFTDGTYTFVCDPHEALGMRGTLTVKGDAAARTK